MTSGRALSHDDIEAVFQALKETGGNKKEAAKLLGIARSALYERLDAAPDVPPPSEFAIEFAPQIGGGGPWEITSTKDNKYRFAAMGDLHAASKYCRWDVREDMTRRAEEFKAMAILDTGNWIDGEMAFNRYDITCVGLEMQLQELARNYPKTKIPTYAITGADHEGWYMKRDGIHVGRNCESVMREHGHVWSDLGYVEADILLRNANSGKTAVLRLQHPGGGSAYATSYKPQKILESLEGGEKPDAQLIGHYHKLEGGLIRGVFYCQTGCQQDQTPFLRTRSIEVHIGGVLLEIEQDPKDGAIIGFKPDMRRYFNKSYYFKEGQANQRYSGHGPIRQVPRAANVKE